MGSNKKILGMGNPLLDAMINVDQDVLDKYGLKMDNAILAEEQHQPLFKEVANMQDVTYVPGGATQNSIRVAQWMNTAKDCASYMGCVGKDQTADKMAALCKEAGVVTAYQKDDEETGMCVVLVKDGERSLCTNLKAANNFKKAHLDTPEAKALVESAEIVYSAGFFLTVSPDSMVQVATHCNENNKTYCLNLAAPFLMQVPPFKAAMNDVMPKCDFIFGNEGEAVTFGESEKWDLGDNVEEIAKKMSLMNNSRSTVVITQGSECTVVAKNGEATKYAVDPLPKEQLVDTNGAGDAFVGGFLAGLSQDKEMEACVKAGHYAAREIIQQNGATIPNKTYTW